MPMCQKEAVSAGRSVHQIFNPYMVHNYTYYGVSGKDLGIRQLRFKESEIVKMWFNKIHSIESLENISLENAESTIQKAIKRWFLDKSTQ
jgi:hypothetical protein